MKFYVYMRVSGTICWLPSTMYLRINRDTGSEFGTTFWTVLCLGNGTKQASLHIESVIHRASESSLSQRFSDMTHAVSNQINGLMFSMEL